MDSSSVTFHNEGESMSPTLLSPATSLRRDSEDQSPVREIQIQNKPPPNLIVTTQLPTSGDFKPQVTVEVGSALSPDAQKLSLVPTSQAFIQIIGLPNGSDPSLVDTVVVHSANVDSPQPIHPQLSPNSAQNFFVDVIDAEDEDPFTLESFDSLLELTAQSGKDFILARVVTVDPHDNSKFYHSYYAAHHINKVLFRTQPEEGLLHRMKAKNPLNNMTIVGDVHYYIITPESYQQARAHLSSKISSPGSCTPTSATSHQHRRDKLFGKKQSTIAEMIRNTLFSSSHTSRDQRKLHLVVTQPDKILDYGNNINAKNSGGKTTTTDENKGRRPSADDIYEFISKSSPIEGKPDGFQWQDLSTLVPTSRPENKINTTTDRGRTRTQTNPPTNRSKSTTNVHAPVPRKENDWVDRFYSRSLLQHRKGITKVKVRSRSYRNERLSQLVNKQNGTSTHHVLSVEEWVSIHCGDQVTELLTSKPSHSSSSSSTTMENMYSPSTRQRRGVQKSPQNNNDMIHLDNVNISRGSSDRRTIKPIQYVAKFFATDDDYLMKSSVRTYFKQNAVEAEDSILFSIPSSTAVVFPQDATEDSLEPHPALNGFSFSVQGGDDNDLLHHGLALRIRRFLRHHHVLKVSLLIYIVAGALVIKFLVPQNLMYLVSFLLVFVLCFFLVFFVEYDV